jgi:hypothetical protein
MQLAGSKHFASRSQQRAIPPFVASVVIDNGKSVRRGDADVFFLDKESRRSVRRVLGARVYCAIERFLDVYVVCADDGCVITTGWRLERIRRS